MTIVYSRRATVSVSAELHRTGIATVLAVRPAVHAIGPFKLRFARENGAVVTMTPVVTTKSGGTRPAHEDERTKDAFTKDIKGKSQFVNPNETLSSSQVFRVDPIPIDVVGWQVSLSIASKGVIRHGLHWADEVFVPIASLPTSGGGHDGSGTEETHAGGRRDGPLISEEQGSSGARGSG